MDIILTQALIWHNGRAIADSDNKGDNISISLALE